MESGFKDNKLCIKSDIVLFVESFQHNFCESFVFVFCLVLSVLSDNLFILVFLHNHQLQWGIICRFLLLSQIIINVMENVCFDGDETTNICPTLICVGFSLAFRALIIIRPFGSILNVRRSGRLPRQDTHNYSSGISEKVVEKCGKPSPIPKQRRRGWKIAGKCGDSTDQGLNERQSS